MTQTDNRLLLKIEKYALHVTFSGWVVVRLVGGAEQHWTG